MVQSREHLDPLGLVAELRGALARPELAEFTDDDQPPSAKARRAAYKLAEALGDCRWFGVSVPADLDGEIPWEAALAAAAELEVDTRQRIGEVSQLEQRIDDCEDVLEVESLCCDVLESVRCAWAVFLAVDEAHQTALEERRQPPHELTASLTRCLGLLDALDQAVLDRAELLTPAADTQLLSNWRQLMNSELQRAPPWWLDGTLEQIAAEIERRGVLTLPNPRPFTAVEALADAADHRVTPAAAITASWNWLSDPLPAIVGDTPDIVAPPVVQMRWWRSPDDQNWACAVDVSGADEIRINFLHGQQSATMLHGKTVVLGEVSATIDLQGHAVFLRRDLFTAKSTGRAAELQVEGQMWSGPFPTRQS